MTSQLLTPEGRDSLAHELCSARRAVGAARLAGDPAAEAMAHARLHSVKVALGAHAEAWWQDA